MDGRRQGCAGNGSEAEVKLSLRIGELRELIRESMGLRALETFIDRNEHLFPPFGRRVGGSGDGITFDSMGGIMKIGAMDQSSFAEMKEHLNELMGPNTANLPIVGIQDWEQVGIMPDGRVVYYYLMEKLKPLSSAEADAVHDYVFERLIRKKDYVPHNSDPNVKRRIEEFFASVERAEEQFGIHSDIKPDNIMKNKRGELKLIDVESFVTSLK